MIWTVYCLCWIAGSDEGRRDGCVRFWSEVCAQLKDNHELRPILPTIGLLAEELRARNIPIPSNNFDLQLIKKAIMDMLSAERSLK